MKAGIGDLLKVETTCVIKLIMSQIEIPDILLRDLLSQDVD